MSGGEFERLRARLRGRWHLGGQCLDDRVALRGQVARLTAEVERLRRVPGGPVVREQLSEELHQASQGVLTAGTSEEVRLAWRRYAAALDALADAGLSGPGPTSAHRRVIADLEAEVAWRSEEVRSCRRLYELCRDGYADLEAERDRLREPPVSDPFLPGENQRLRAERDEGRALARKLLDPAFSYELPYLHEGFPWLAEP